MTRMEEALFEFFRREGVRPSHFRGEYFIAVKGVHTACVTDSIALGPSKGTSEVINLSELARFLEMVRA